MTYSDNDKQEIFDALKQFQKEESWRSDLTKWTNRFNIFDVLKISGMEIRHSNMLAWLLDPHETHGWGTSFLKEFLQNFNGGYNWINEELIKQCSTFTVYREYANIDLLLVSETCRTVIAIENKVYSSQHSNQLERYYNTVCHEFNEGWNKLFIYLTLDSEEPSHEAWERCSHETILDLLETSKKTIRTAEQPLILINNYTATLRRLLMKDEELIAACDKIYNKYKKAIDFIIENKTDNRRILMEKMKKIFNKRKPEILFKDENANKKYIWFHTKSMDSFLKPLETGLSSWGKKCIYKYEICSEYNEEDNKFHLSAYLVLGGWNVPQAERQLMSTIVHKFNTKDKNKDDFKFKKIKENTKTKKREETADIPADFENLEKEVNRLIDHLLKFEREELLPLLNQH